MITTTIRVALGPRERQVLEGLAAGDTLMQVARDLGISYGTAQSYRKVAKEKLFGVSEAVAAVAAGYAANAISRPPLLSVDAPRVSASQRLLIPLIARGMTSAQMATEVRRPVDDVRADALDLRETVGARNTCHLITLLWQHQLVTADEVTRWLK
ncbi:LuxR C-terminal-related transcriptional regulator [Streptomyces sp. NPDC056296]|uniref:LuxR C-terminal-related transcriptional regulator n=1 Tax=Streptomyces sp. NPDC056296 TaxID=3345775 RepID=UPI0035D6381C